MLSNEQYDEKELRVLKTVEDFIKTGDSNIDIANRLGYSSSSVQRYLTDKNTITLLLGADTYEFIQKKIKENKKNALSKGGKVSQSRHYQTRDKNGHYTGNIKK